MLSLSLLVCLLVTSSTLRAGTLPWLDANGPSIVNADGQKTLLGGVNLGGWLVEEMWMMPFQTEPPAGSPFKPVKDHVSLWSVVTQRFGPVEANHLKQALRKAWITEADFDRIQAAGHNCIRLPFLYDLIDEKDGFGWLDKAISWASERGMYVILDLHGAPGRQSGEHHTGETGVNRLFSDPEMAAETEAVWRRIAQRYRDRPEVAGYDLLNEPMGASDSTQLYRLQDSLYHAIRAVDPRHLIFIEDGYKGMQQMPIPAAKRWTNVVLSVHSYYFDAKTEPDHRKNLERFCATVAAQQRLRAAPFYLGEFNLEPHGTPATVAAYLAAMRQRGWSWSFWTYKTFMKGGSGDTSMWGWIRSPKPAAAPLNPFTDSVAELLRKIELTRTEKLQEHQLLGQALVWRPAD